MTMTASRPRKAGERDQRAERHADQRGEQHGAQADQQRQPHDGEQRGIAGEHQVQRGSVTRHAISTDAPRPANGLKIRAESLLIFCAFIP